MRESLARMLAVGRKLLAGEPLRRPHEDRYYRQGRLVPEVEAQPSAARAVDMLMAKLRGEPYYSEVQLPVFRPPEPPPQPRVAIKIENIIANAEMGRKDRIETPF